jgi:hypothetical protein
VCCEAGTNTGAEALEARVRNPAPPVGMEGAEEGAREVEVLPRDPVAAAGAGHRPWMGRVGGWGAANVGPPGPPGAPECHTEAGPRENRGAYVRRAPATVTTEVGRGRDAEGAPVGAGCPHTAPPGPAGNCR